MNVSAIIVTRGDVELQPIIDSLPRAWEAVIWDNGEKRVSRSDGWAEVCTDLSVYGRYAAIEYATHDCIYVQDDDVIVSEPQAIVQAHQIEMCGDPKFEWDGVVANMPQEFRHSGYTDSCLVGFGACFHRDLPGRAFDLFNDTAPGLELSNYGWWLPHEEKFLRTCDVVFTTLTPRVLVDVPKTNLDYATGPDRMYRQADHVGERARMLDLARKVRDA